jgi:peptidyl-prolyl cis-trans isomerase C
MARVTTFRRPVAPILAATAIALLSAMPGAQAATAADNPVVAQINGKSYHRSDLAPILERLQQQNQQLQGMTLEDPSIYPQLVQQLVTGVLVVDAAEKAKLDRDATFKKRMSELRATMLENYYAETVITHAATPEAEKALYDKKVAKNDVPLEVHARHILVGTEQEAKDVIDQLNKGGDFVKLAHDKSLDTNSDGGDLHWFTAQQILPELSQAAFNLKKGEYTKTPVHTKFGYHIVQVLDTRPAPLDDIRNQLGGEIARDAIRTKVTALKTAAKITIYGLDGKPIAAPAQ